MIPRRIIVPPAATRPEEQEALQELVAHLKKQLAPTFRRGTVTGAGSLPGTVAIAGTGESAADLHPYPVLTTPVHKMFVGQPAVALATSSGNLNLGTGAPVQITADSTDTRGTIQFGTGTTPSGVGYSDLVNVTFSITWPATPYVLLTATNANVMTVFGIVGVSTRSTTGFTFGARGGGAVNVNTIPSEPVTYFSVDYLCLTSTLALAVGADMLIGETQPGNPILFGQVR